MTLHGGFVALTAIGGGIAMATGLDPLPLEWLEGTPFETFLHPGVLLATLVGGNAAIAMFALDTSPRAGTLLTVVAGSLLMAWIVSEVLLLDQPSWTRTEAIYFGIGPGMVVLGAFHGWSS